MVIQQFDQYIPELENPNMYQSFDDTEEDSLSFCDLPIYGDASDWEEFSREIDQTSSSSSSETEDQQYFEFFSEEWTSPNKSHQSNESIVFCGKLIPYKQPAIDYNHNRQIDEHSKRSVLRWNSKSSNKSISSKSNNSKKLDERYSFPVSRTSILASPVKSRSRWYLIMFGLARFPAEMELRDIRRRQSRKSMKSNGGGEKSDLSRGKGLWGMIRALGCGGHHHANAAVKAAYGCAPQVVR